MERSIVFILVLSTLSFLLAKFDNNNNNAPPLFPLSLPSTNNSGPGPRLHWGFVFYHKTGTELTLQIVQNFAKTCNAKFSGVKVNYRFFAMEVSFSTHVKNVSFQMGKNRQNSIIGFDAPDLSFKWDETLVNNQDAWRFVHFVRDPYGALRFVQFSYCLCLFLPLIPIPTFSFFPMFNVSSHLIGISVAFF